MTPESTLRIALVVADVEDGKPQQIIDFNVMPEVL